MRFFGQLKWARLSGLGLEDGLGEVLNCVPYLEAIDLSRNGVGDDICCDLARMHRLKRINLALTRVTDVGMRRLAESRSCEELNICDTDIGDAGIEWLSGCVQLRALYIGKTFGTCMVSDVGIHALRPLSNLSRLSLVNCVISDKAMADLEVLPSLLWLYLNGASVSEAAVQRFMLRRPEVTVVR